MKFSETRKNNIQSYNPHLLRVGTSLQKSFVCLDLTLTVERQSVQPYLYFQRIVADALNLHGLRVKVITILNLIEK